MTLSEWLFKLENRYTQEIQLGLARITEVAERLNLLRLKAKKIITVGGTNGKGSTVALLESIYQAAGYQVASYTSPHLLTFNERIKVGKLPISDDDLVAAFDFIETGRGEIPLTYFEMATLAAFWYFNQFSLDVIILEVGLGGRLDATNIIDADLAIITTIDFDHEAFLGNTLEAIGYEKSGILRAHKPLIYADFNPPSTIVSEAKVRGAILYRNGIEYQCEACEKGYLFSYQQHLINLPNTLYHPHVVAAATMATLCLQAELPLTAEQRIMGINHTVLLGRLQSVKTQKSLVILDVAHNVQAVRRLKTYLEKKFPRQRIHAVFSALADKNTQGLILPLKPVISYWYPSCLPSKRGASKEQLEQALKHCEVGFDLCYNTPVLAYEAALNRALPDEIIVVFGSFITVGCVLSSLSNPIVKEII